MPGRRRAGARKGDAGQPPPRSAILARGDGLHMEAGAPAGFLFMLPWALITFLAIPVLEVVADPFLVTAARAEAALPDVEEVLGRRRTDSEVPVLALVAELAGLRLALEEGADR